MVKHILITTAVRNTFPRCPPRHTHTPVCVTTEEKFPQQPPLTAHHTLCCLRILSTSLQCRLQVQAPPSELISRPTNASQPAVQSLQHQTHLLVGVLGQKPFVLWCGGGGGECSPSFSFCSQGQGRRAVPTGPGEVTAPGFAQQLARWGLGLWAQTRRQNPGLP